MTSQHLQGVSKPELSFGCRVGFHVPACAVGAGLVCIGQSLLRGLHSLSTYLSFYESAISLDTPMYCNQNHIAKKNLYS